MKRSSDNYISLQEATEYCSYSQEYLSLRARQGKLKAVKFGRNWVTKKEWLGEYLKNVEEYNNNLITQKIVAPPRNLPIESPAPLVRFGFVAVLVFVLLVAGATFGKEPLKNVYRDIESYTYIVGGAGDIIVEKVTEVLAETVSDVPQSFAAVSLSTASIGDTFKEYGQWIGGNTAEWFSSQIEEIALGISNIPETLKGFSQTITEPFRKKVVLEKVTPEISTKEIEELRAEIQRLKEEGLPVKEITKEVSKVTQIEPVKEITREVTEIDEKELAKLKAQLVDINLWGVDIEELREITQKLQAYPAGVPVPTAPIYIGSQGLQVGGVGNFTSLAVSGSTGMNYLGVGGSASIGSRGTDTFTVKATSNFQAPIRATSTLTVDGAISTAGNLTVGGNATIAGTLNVGGGVGFAGPLVITSNVAPQLSVRHDAANKLDVSVTAAGDVTLDATSALNLTGNAASTWQTTAGLLTIQIDGASGFVLQNNAGVPIKYLEIDNTGKLILRSETAAAGQDIVIDSGSGKITLGAGDQIQTSTGGAASRASGEQILKEVIPVFGFEMPVQTKSAVLVTVSRIIESNPFTPAIAGTVRKYKFVIRYADDFAAGGTTDWKVNDLTVPGNSVTFTIPTSSTADLTKGEVEIKEVNIGTIINADDDWELQVKTDGVQTIRIYQIFLAAYDEVL